MQVERGSECRDWAHLLKMSRENFDGDGIFRNNLALGRGNFG